MVNKNDIIIWNDFDVKDYDIAINKAVVYAILSVPYTYDRLGLGYDNDGIRERIKNITKGKVAEYLFELYCKSKGIKISRKDNETPFWRYDKNDFIINDMIIDVKNNIIRNGNTFIKDEVLNFPALVPCDQVNGHIKPVNFAYVFTFMLDNDFFTIDLNDDTLQYISKLNNFCCGKQLDSKPSYFKDKESYFREIFRKFGGIKTQKIVIINNHPDLIIGGIEFYNHKDFENKFDVVNSGTLFKYESGYIRTRVGNYMTKVKNLEVFKF